MALRYEVWFATVLYNLDYYRNHDIVRLFNPNANKNVDVRHDAEVTELSHALLVLYYHPQRNEQQQLDVATTIDLMRELIKEKAKQTKGFLGSLLSATLTELTKVRVNGANNPEGEEANLSCFESFPIVEANQLVEIATRYISQHHLSEIRQAYKDYQATVAGRTLRPTPPSQEKTKAADAIDTNLWQLITSEERYNQTVQFLMADDTHQPWRIDGQQDAEYIKINKLALYTCDTQNRSQGIGFLKPYFDKGGYGQAIDISEGIMTYLANPPGQQEHCVII